MMSQSAFSFQHQPVEESTPSAFSTGKKIQITTRRQREEDEPDAATHGRRRERARISIKDRRPITASRVTVGGSDSVAEEGSAAALSLHVENESASDLLSGGGTASRRRVVVSRARDRREHAHDSRRFGSASSSSSSSRPLSQASGFNTRHGQRRALIVLPKSEEKMSAREKLMQIHPHIAQLFRGLNPPDVFQNQPFSRVLEAEAPTLPYRRRNMETKTVVQWGERKLFLIELEFLTTYAVRENTVVLYAGCAPGTRFPYLAELFPHVSFILVDDTPLDIDEVKYNNVTVRQETFNDAMAREYKQAIDAAGQTLLFITFATNDTPLGGLLPDTSKAEQYGTERSFTAESMAAQKRWHTILKPAKSLLKFSLPWTDGDTYYLDGEAILCPWAPPTSVETRLIPNQYHRTWSHKYYEEQMFFFQTHTRVSLHEHGVTAEGLDGCWDCTSEVFILERYLERFPHMLPVACGSQLGVAPSASQPSIQLKLDTTRFRDPIWLKKQEERELQRRKKASMKITLEQDEEEEDGGAAEQMEAEATMEEKNQSPDAGMAEESKEAEQLSAAGEMDTAAAASMSVESAAAGGESSMEDAAPIVALSPLEELKVNVGKMSQELSRRLTHGGTRTLATVNDTIIKRAAFSRKNRV